MKTIITLYFLLLSGCLFAQKDTVIVNIDSNKVSSIWHLSTSSIDSMMPLVKYNGSLDPYSLLIFTAEDSSHWMSTGNQLRWYNNFQTGTGMSFHKNGELSNISHYKHGRIHGPFMEFYENGNKKAEGSFNQNAKEGTWKYFYSNGTLKAKGDYLDSVLIIYPLIYRNKDSVSIYGKNHKLLNTLNDFDPELNALLDALMPDVGNEKRFLSLPNCIYFKNGYWLYYNSEGILVEIQYWQNGELKKVTKPNRK